MTRYVFKDTETSGADTRYDQIFQFAAIACDEALNELDVVDVRSRRLPHVLPSPVALKVTNIDPWTLKNAAMSYFDFASFIHSKYREWSPATFMGHNTLGFDEEIERSMFWLNLLDPYVTNSKGSARADTLVMLRAGCALRPDLLVIRNHPETGSPIFKLEVIAPDNGFEGHAAHDALGDIRANIHVARIMKLKAPDLWASLMRNTVPGQVEDLLNNPAVLMMTHFGKPEFFPAMKIAMSPSNKRQALMLNLSMDFAPWLDKSPEEIKAGMFSKESPFQTIKTNAQPTVFSPTDPIAAAKWTEVASKLPDLQERQVTVKMHPTFLANCVQALKLNAESFPKSAMIEEQIYDGFPSYADKDRMKALHAHDNWEERRSTASGFQDPRLRKIFTRILWAEAPHLLEPGLVAAIDASIAANRVLGNAQVETRWTTIEKAKAEMAQIAGHPLYDKIQSWFQTLEREVSQDPAAARRLAAIEAEPSQQTQPAAIKKKPAELSLD